MNYLGYDLKPFIINALKDLKFKSFTDVQKRTFDSLKTDKNILAKSKTGSGKTHAFLIPIFNDLDPNLKEVQATIITPTKELALQIYKVAQHIASFSSDEISIRNYAGGTDRDREISKLKSTTPQIVIGTPGKINDLAVKENALKIYTSKYFVIDEVDMAFEQGFSEDLDHITSVCINARMMFFSATISEHITPYIKKYMTNVEEVSIKDNTTLNIKHIWLPLKHKERYDCLKTLLNTFNPFFCIVFCNKKEEAKELYGLMSKDNYSVTMLQGDMSPRERKRVLNECKDLKYQFLVATDLAARGIDIEGVSHIINYTLPSDYEFYIHRSGRTGRMYNSGVVYTLYEDLDDAYLNNLEKKGVKPEYFEIKNGEIQPYKGRNMREKRIKPETDYEKQARKYIKKDTKVKPGYKKEREAKVKDLALKLKQRDKRKKK